MEMYVFILCNDFKYTYKSKYIYLYVYAHILDFQNSTFM